MNKILIVLFSLLCALLMYFASGLFDNFSTRVYLSSLIIQFISIYHIFSKENQPFSLNKIFYLFSLFFFGISPLIQYYEGVSQFGARHLKENEYFYMNILVIFILLLYQLFYSYFYQRKISDKSKNLVSKFEIYHKLNSSQILLLIFLSIISFLMIYNVNNHSIVSMLFRGGEFKELIQMSTTSNLIITRVFQPLAMMSLLYYISSKSSNIFIYFVLTLLTLITCSPLGMARFSAAAMYIPLILLVFPILRKKNVFSIVFILGLLLIFPFLDNFRNYSGGSIQFGFNFDMFLQGHFDSYQNFALIVSDNIITWGRQLLGVILFWIPRSIWPNKPIGSGAFVAEEEGFIYSNVSCNYFGEGYINFGYLGILIFIIALSLTTAKLDKIYWTINVYNENNYSNVIYYVLLGMLFFILRGDLMSSFAYTIGFLFSIWLVYKVAGFKIKRI